MNPALKTLVYWVVVGLTAILIWEVVRAPTGAGSIPEISYSRFMQDVDAGKVASVAIAGNQIQGQYRDDQGKFRLTGPNNPGVYLDTLRNKGIEIRFRDSNTASLPLQLLGTWAPLILLCALWIFMIRRMRTRNSGPPNQMPPGGGIRPPDWPR